jgi:hypothetical protein
MVNDLRHIFAEATSIVSTHFNTPELNQSLTHVEIDVVDSKGMAESLNLDNYRLKSRVPAYYNPNNHTIYLNKDILYKLKPSTILNICYHELLHAISAHKTWNEKRKTFFQSGLKLEIYEFSTYKCKNRALNEGIVQYFTNKHTNAPEPAYLNEVSLVGHVTSVLGENTFQNALLTGDHNQLQQKFDAIYGINKFEQFSAALDKKEFIFAASLLIQETVLIPSSFAYQSVTA